MQLMTGSIKDSTWSTEGNMSYRLKEVSNQIAYLKSQLNRLWDENGHTNDEILRISEKIDSLLNEHDRLLQRDVTAS